METKKTVKKLVLNTETVRELTGAQLEAAVGGQPFGPWTPVILTVPVDRCLKLSAAMNVCI